MRDKPERKMKTSVILKTLAQIQQNYNWETQEYLALEKAMLIISTLTRVQMKLASQPEFVKHPFE